jgi:RNase P subunit RPR2
MIKRLFCKHRKLKPIILDDGDIYLRVTKGIQLSYHCENCGKIIIKSPEEK